MSDASSVSKMPLTIFTGTTHFEKRLNDRATQSERRAFARKLRSLADLVEERELIRDEANAEFIDVHHHTQHRDIVWDEDNDE